jgi:DeoR/GlpR family transcriptional regulator of sugar metabolism
MNNKRQSHILRILEQKGEVQLQQLKKTFPDVSTMTLRRDLISLESEGYLIRTYGGAVNLKKLNNISGEEDEYSKRALENVESKVIIAEKAAALLEKGRSIYIDAGSTTMCLAQIIPDELFSVVTSGVNIGIELVKKHSISVFTLGGLMNRNTLSVSGPAAVEYIKDINIDIAFMSASAISLDSGCSVSNVYESELKRNIIEKAKKIVLLADSSKINKNLPFSYAKLEDVDIWVCDSELPDDYKEAAKKLNVKII